MKDIHSIISQLKRPRLLVQAARFGIDDYRRETELPRLLKTETLPRPAEALLRLLELEAEHNEDRVTGATKYSAASQVNTLTAIMSEARLLRAVSPESA